MTDVLQYIKKLIGDNYPVWEVRIKALPVSKGLSQQADPTADDENSTNRQKSRSAYERWR